MRAASPGDGFKSTEWVSGFFDKESFHETMAGWAKTGKKKWTKVDDRERKWIDAVAYTDLLPCLCVSLCLSVTHTHTLSLSLFTLSLLSLYSLFTLSL